SGDTTPYVEEMLMMLPAVARADRKHSMNACEATSALLRCDSSIASQADSGYCSKRPVSSAASDGDDPSPALLMRIVGVPNFCATAATAASIAARFVASTAWTDTARLSATSCA